jgi:hypothetical protein
MARGKSFVERRWEIQAAVFLEFLQTLEVRQIPRADFQGDGGRSSN